MDEEYSESVDTSADMDVSDTDVAEDIPAAIPDDVPEDIPEDDYSDSDVADDFSEDVSDDAVTDEAEYDDADDSIKEDSIEPEAEEMDDSIDDFEEDSYDYSETPHEDDAETEDISEDLDEIEETAVSEMTDVEDVPEDTGSNEDVDQDESYGDEIAEDVADDEVPEETADTEDTEVAEQPEDVTDAEETDETYDAEDADTTEQPEDVSDTEAADESVDVDDTATAEQPDNQSDLETYEYETSPETQDAVNPETSGEFVSAKNPYRERWEKFGEEFSDGSETDGWDSLKDVPFRGDEKTDTDSGTEGADVGDSATPSETTDVDNSSEASEINSISDYMNAHNYGPDDFATYSQDPQWRQLMRQEYPDYELPEMTQESANAQLSQYMNDHNYGVDDYAEYSKDPIWRELHSTAFPDDELPQLNDASQEQQKPAIAPSGGGNPPPGGAGISEGNPPKNPDDIDEGQLFGSFETDKHINGSDSFVKGENYEQFKKDYYSPEESSYEAYDTPKEIDISPSMIEGIHLGERELENPDVFWSQHEKDGTLDSFKDVASHIPDVREQLAAGKSMDELLADPELSECAGIYFANKPKVIENDGYYEFDSNGRHRILAAREAGYDIPVEVIGRSNRNEGTESQGIDSEVGELHANIGGGLSEQSEDENKEFGSFSDKIRNFFTPAKDTDLIEPGTVNTPESNQDVQTKWTPPAIQGVDVKEPEADIAPLDSTRQTINLVDLPDGSKARVFDHPNDLRNVLPFSQGKNEYSKSGTCALADTGTWLKVAGSKHVENDVVGFASTHTDRHGQPLCSKSGGTLPSNIPDIWEHFGIPAYSDGYKNLENIAQAVESGRAVSVGVNAGTLWEQDNTEGIKIPQNCYGDGGANHAIGIMSCERDPISGNITHFYINDTGRTYERDACRRISISDFWKAFNVKRACATISQKPVW